MIHLVYGGSGSGKSAYAEKIVMELNSQNRYYLATMKVYGKEGMEKVQRHKTLRSGKGFVTLERETLDCLPSIMEIVAKENSTILIECISNLVANEMFKEKEIISPKKVFEKIRKDFLMIMDCTENMVIVSNNVFEDGIEYDENTKNYLKALGKTNAFLADFSHKVTEVVCGIPVELK